MRCSTLTTASFLYFYYRPYWTHSAILYSGQVIGTDEKQTVLEYLRALPLKSFTVLVCDFANWAETAPLPCIILKK